MRTRSWLPALLVVAWVGSARSYTGGPEYVEVLGWDPAERKVFCAIHNRDESGDAPGLVYFPLDSLRQSLGVRVEWSRQGTPDEAMRDPRRERILARLRPLALVEGPAIPRGSGVIVADSVVNQNYGIVPRFRVRVGSTWDAGAPNLEVITYYDPTVTFHRVYRIPGRNERIVVLSFIGQTYGGEEVQVPVLLRGPSTPPILVDWQRWHSE